MSVAIRIDDERYIAAQNIADEEHSADEPMAFWARLGQSALDNPDLPIRVIMEILISKHQGHELAEPLTPFNQ